ncbi:MAG: fimbria/pilus outer membrane usher protein, partial [Acidobacteriota bacterium]
SGLGNTLIVVRDVFGRTQEFGSTYYLPLSLLAPGTREYQYAVGVDRHPDVTAPAAYGPWSALGADRIGVTRSLTVGYRVEMNARTATAASTLDARLWHFGEVAGGVHFSRQGSQSGHAMFASYAFTTRGIGLSVNGRSASPGDMTLGAPASGIATTHVAAALSLPAGHGSSVSLQYLRGTIEDGSPTVTVIGQQASVTGSWRPFSRVEFNSTVTASGQPARAWSVAGFASLTVVIGPRAVASVTHAREGGRPTTVIEAQQSAPVGNGLGYRLRATRDSSDALHGELKYRSPFGEYQVVRDSGPASETLISASGGLVAIGRRLFATRAVSTSFALVQVPDAAGVRVYADHHEVGRTNAGGRLLVPNLLAYHANRLGIADSDLPIDYDIKATDANVAPPFRGGAIVRFVGQHIRTIAGSVTVTESNVTIVPAFGSLELTAGALRFVSPIGDKGEFYFENVPPGSYPAQVLFDGEACALTLAVPASPLAFLNLGTLSCERQSIPRSQP